MVEIATLVIVAVVGVILVTAVIFGLVKFLKKPNTSVEEAVANNDLKNSINNLKDNLPLTVNAAVANQMIAIQNALANQNEATNKRINELNSKMDEKLNAITKSVGEGLAKGFKDNGDVMAQLQKELGSITEAQNNIKNLSTDVVSLKNVLTNNQSRGRFGEIQLEMLLENIFNGSKGTLYDTQIVIAKDKDGKELKPDAIVYIEGKIDGKLVCIDSKFSITGLEELFDTNKTLDETTRNGLISSFKTAMKNRIKETSKYVIPGRTAENSILFVPNDGIFAFIENECHDICDAAKEANVVLACPTIIRPLLGSLRMIQIDALRSKNLEIITNNLASLGEEFKRFSERWNTINKQINTVNGSIKDFNISVNKINKKFTKISNSETPQIEDQTDLEEIEQEEN